MGSGCVLEFEGGSISGNQTLTGASTGIQAGIAKLFGTDVTLAGSWIVPIVYPEWFGAIGDGTTVDDTPFAKMADFINNNTNGQTTIMFGHKHYIFNTGIQIKKDIVIDGGGTILEYTVATAEAIYYGLTLAKDNNKVLLNAGSVSGTKNTKIITTTNSVDLVAGDFIVIEDNTDYSYSTERASYHAGDILQVESISGTTINVTEELTQNYSGANIVLYKLNTIQCKVSDINFVCHYNSNITANGLAINSAVNSTINNIVASGSWHIHILADFSYNINITNCYINSKTPIHGLNYGVCISCSKKVNISDCFLKTSRHGLTHGGGNNAIPNRLIKVIGNTIDDFGELGQCLDFHGNAENVLVEGNILLSGLCCQAGNASIIGNKIYGKLYFSGVVAGNNLVESNHFVYNDYNGEATTACVQIVDGNNPDNTFIPEYKIYGNTFNCKDNTDPGKTGCILVQGECNCAIDNNNFNTDNWASIIINVISPNTEIRITNNKNCFVYVDSSKIKVLNVISNFLRGTYMQGNVAKTLFCNNTIKESDTAPIIYANTIEGESILIVEDNTFINCNRVKQSWDAYDTILRVQYATKTYFRNNEYLCDSVVVDILNDIYMEGTGYIEYINNTLSLPDMSIFRERELPAGSTSKFESLLKSGTSNPSKHINGQVFFNETLGKPVWWNGSDWVDATGATV